MNRHFPVYQIYADSPIVIDWTFLQTRSYGSQECANTRHEFLDTEWFGHVIVSARI